MVLHDGTQNEISDAEKALVGQRFASFVDIEMLAGRFGGNVRPGDDIMVPTSLLLRRLVAPDEYWVISVEDFRPFSSDLPPAESIIKSILLQRVSGEAGHEIVAYRLGGDAVVRRWDGGDAATHLEHDRQMGVNLPPDEMSEVDLRIRELLGYLLGGRSNRRLEADMGINLQPIGLPELEGLIAFVTHPDAAPAPGI